MNVNTGELKSISGSYEAFAKDNPDFKEVPKELYDEVAQELGDELSTFVDMTKNTPLVKWAKSQQKKAKAKVKRKMAKKSRQTNNRRKK